MVTEGVTLAGSVDDIRGLGVSVYQDHGGVRIDVGGIEIMLEIGGLQKFMHLLAEAACDSRLWEIGQSAPRQVPCCTRAVHDSEAGWWCADHE